METSFENDDNSSCSPRAPSPDLFSSEDEELYRTEDDSNLLKAEDPPGSQRKSGQDLVLELESARLQRLMSLLQGVPPPPSITIPQISLSEVLQKLKDNADIMARSNGSSEPVDSLWKPSASLEDVKKTEWPEIKNIIYHDMHFNHCPASEDVEHVTMKLHERFIGAETSSWCNAFTSSIPSSANRRQRRSLGNTSPGCRLSHLAKRRQTFSSANLAQLSVAGSGTAGGAPAGPSSLINRRLINGRRPSQRCIMLEIKKTDKNKRIKTNSKEALDKLAQSSLITKAVAPVASQSTKRALFQSPEEQKRAASANSKPPLSDLSGAQRSKRALWPSDQEGFSNENGKRSRGRNDSSNLPRSKLHCSDDKAPYSRATRSLPFPLGQNSSSNDVESGSNCAQASNAHESNAFSKPLRRASDQGPSTQGCSIKMELSELHKRKLFWAILSSLRPHGITKTHEDFSRMCSELAIHYIEVRSKMTGRPPASTSEHMLQVVSAKAKEMLQSAPLGSSGQEENIGGSRALKKEERCNRELFRDATASLNVRRSLCVPLPSSNHHLSDDKQKQTKRVPSARKSLSFDGMDSKSSSGLLGDATTEKAENKFQLDAKSHESKWRGNGENIPLASAKRVSRSLFLSPKDDVKTAKKDACEQTNASDTQTSSIKSCEEGVTVDDSNKKTNGTDVSVSGAVSELSSIPSVSLASSTLEADNEASRTSDATNHSGNSADSSVKSIALNTIVHSKDNDSLRRTNDPSVRDHMGTDCVSSESSDFTPARVLRETKERAARLCTVQPFRRSGRKSLSLSQRELRCSSSDSTEQSQGCRLVDKASLSIKGAETIICTSIIGICPNLDPTVVLSPLKIPSPLVSTESNTTSKSTFGSPPFIVSSTASSPHSPFIGFPAKEDMNYSGGAVDESDSNVKMPDNSSEEGNLSGSEHVKADLEEKVITPLLEAAVLESSICVGSGSSHSNDADLSFRGRIESLKPSAADEESINLDLGMNLNVSANILNLDETKEKSPVLEKWAERASRSAQKSFIASEVDTDPLPEESACISGKTSDPPAEESMLPWDDSHLAEVSQCSTNMFEKFCSIFDPSRHQGNA